CGPSERGTNGPDADHAPASIPILMQERLVEACLMRGRPARADSTLALRGLQAETSIDEERTLPRRPSPHRGCPAYRRGSDRGSCDDYRRRNGGAEGSRTPDPKTARLVLSQLS